MTAHDHGRPVRLGPADALPEGTGVQVRIDDDELAVFNVDGTIRAVSGRCRHQGAPLAEGTLETGCVRCPWHDWTYDLRTGRRTDRPGSPLTTHRLSVHDGWIICLDPP